MYVRTFVQINTFWKKIYVVDTDQSKLLEAKTIPLPCSSFSQEVWMEETTLSDSSMKIMTK